MNAAEIASRDIVVEIGPGKGILTRALAERGADVIAVEIDDMLASSLAEEFKDVGNVTMMTADARKVDVDALAPKDATYKMVANLPYYAASPIIRRF